VQRLEVLIAVMLARERRAPADAAADGCTELAAALATLSVRNNHGIPIRDPPTPREIPPRLPPEPKPSPPLESRSVTPRQLTTHPRSKMKV
jgi:hypothetical protein